MSRTLSQFEEVSSNDDRITKLIRQGSELQFRFINIAFPTSFTDEEKDIQGFCEFLVKYLIDANFAIATLNGGTAKNTLSKAIIDTLEFALEFSDKYAANRASIEKPDLNKLAEKFSVYIAIEKALHLMQTKRPEQRVVGKLG